ncbi:DnaA regulatory inactivator Hda [Rickettsiales bacterium Ac37b]|nr:DnaA regulatory inactivator Hda [Rickettsiales bacterium Ac37b]
MNKQIYFELKPNQEYTDTDFIISSANEEAVNKLTSWPNKTDINQIHGIILYGPEHSGKTHLCHIWQNKTRAIFINSLYNLHQIIQSNCYIVEDIDELIPQHEENFLHLLNTLIEHKYYFIFTSKFPPSSIMINLPDLASRIRAMHNIEIKHPDEPLLKALMIKYFSERQLKIDLNVIDYLLVRIERSCGAVRNIVELIDKHSLAEKRNVTIKFAHYILNNMI